MSLGLIILCKVNEIFSLLKMSYTSSSVFFIFFVKLYQLFATESCCRKVSLGCSVLLFFNWNKYIKNYTIIFQKVIFGLKSSYHFKGKHIVYISYSSPKFTDIALVGIRSREKTDDGDSWFFYKTSHSWYHVWNCLSLSTIWL